MEETKKIIIRSDKKNKSLKNKDLTLNTLIKEPEKIKKYVESLENNELKSWFHPNKSMENQQINKAIENIHSCLKKSKKSLPKKNNTQHGSSLITNATSTNIVNNSKNLQMKKKVSKKTNRKYKKHEIKQIVKSCKEYYLKKNYNEFHKILKKINQNQCEQILLQEYILHKNHKNVPLPILKFILYIHLSCPYLDFKVE